jgi:hypothetical protein
MIVGAYALGTHGYPRATGDIDIWVKPDPINSRKIYKALARFHLTGLNRMIFRPKESFSR